MLLNEAVSGLPFKYTKNIVGVAGNTCGLHQAANILVPVLLLEFDLQNGFAQIAMEPLSDDEVDIRIEKVRMTE